MDNATGGDNVGEPQDVIAERIVRELLMPYSTGSSQATITVNAGGVGVWVAVTCCAISLATVLLGALWVSREFTRSDQRAAEQEVKIDRANTFLSAIWAQAPELEKKIKAREKGNAE